MLLKGVLSCLLPPFLLIYYMTSKLNERRTKTCFMKLSQRIPILCTDLRCLTVFSTLECLLWQLGWWFLPINSPDLLLQFTPYIMLSHGYRWQFDTAACAQTWLLRSDADLLFVQGIELTLFTAGGCSECPSKHPDLLFRAATEPITSIRYLSLVQRDERGPKMINKASNVLSMPDFSSNHPYYGKITP